MAERRSGRLISVNGTELYVEERGDPAAPALVYLHGGPGKGAFDFMAIQGDRLSAGLRLIGVDQRGVLRSASLDPEDRPTVEQYVEDFDQVRQALGIDTWSLLGHSAGGAMALDYVLAHPNAVESVVFDCRAWDVDLTDRHRLPAAAAIFDELGDTASARRCRELAGQGERLGFDDRTWQFLGRLGDRVGCTCSTAPVTSPTSSRPRSTPTSWPPADPTGHLPSTESGLPAARNGGGGVFGRGDCTAEHGRASVHTMA